MILGGFHQPYPPLKYLCLPQSDGKRPHHTSSHETHTHTLAHWTPDWNCMVIRSSGWINGLRSLKGVCGTGGGEIGGGCYGGRHKAQIDVRSPKMKIATRDKRKGGSRHGGEKREKGGKLICLGDGMSHGREEQGWINGGRVRGGENEGAGKEMVKEHILLGGWSAMNLCNLSNT